MKLLVDKKVGRNGWAVMVVLCRKVYADGRLGRTPAAEIAEASGLTAYQVARGMKELRDKELIAPVTRKTAQGYRHPDRSNYGHVAQYRFTKKAWGEDRDGSSRQPMIVTYRHNWQYANSRTNMADQRAYSTAVHVR